MKTRTTTINVYEYDELDDKAKAKARDWFTSGIENEEYSEHVLEDAKEIGELLGIEFKTRQVELMNGKFRTQVCIWWSGFSSQGDGASFEGQYSYAKDSVRKVTKHAPHDTELRRIARELSDHQRNNRKQIVIGITSNDAHYSHSNTMQFEDESELPENVYTAEVHKAVCQLLRDLADWIYTQLRTEYDWQTADEQVEEGIRANKYEFTEDGRIT